MLGKILVLSSFSCWVIHWIYTELLGYSWLNVLCDHEVVGLFVVTPLVSILNFPPLCIPLQLPGKKKTKLTSCKSNQNKYFQMLLSKIGSETTRILAPWSMGRISDKIGRIQGGMAIVGRMLVAKVELLRKVLETREGGKSRREELTVIKREKSTKKKK